MVFFLTSLCGADVFMFVFLAFSSFSSWVASFSLNFTQVVSHNAHISSHTTPLISQVTQLISHNSSHSTHLTQLNSLKSCFRVAFGGAAFVFSHWTSPKFFHTTHLTTHTTHLTQLHSSHNSHNSSHTTPLISQLTELVSHNSAHVTTHTTPLISQVTPVTDHERAVPVSALREERWWGCCACVCIGTWTLSSHPTPPPPPPPTPPPTPPHWNMKERGLSCSEDRFLHFVEAQFRGSKHQCARMTALCARMTRFLCARMTRLQCAQMTRFQCAQMTRWPPQMAEEMAEEIA